MFKIEKNVALPSAVRVGKSKYPWADMEVGDSFFVPDAKVSTFYTLTNGQNKKDPSKRFIARAVDGGVRVWRVEVETKEEVEETTITLVDADADNDDDNVVPAFIKKGAKA